MDAETPNNKSGQSVVEFCIGLVAILTVVTGVLQLGLMGIGRTNARVEATEAAAVESMSPPNTSFQTIHTYVRAVTAGPDGRAYSADDTETIAGVNEVYERILEANQPSVLSGYVSGNDLANIQNQVDMQAMTGLVRGSAIESGIPVMPIVRELFFDQNSVDIEMDVWSVRTGGLY